MSTTTATTRIVLDGYTSGALQSGAMTSREFRTLRKRLWSSQEKAAHAFGVHRLTVTRWETGELKIPKMAAELIRCLTKDSQKKGGAAPTK